MAAASSGVAGRISMSAGGCMDFDCSAVFTGAFPFWEGFERWPISLDLDFRYLG